MQQLLGHASIAITERYCAVDDDEMRAADSDHRCGTGVACADTTT
jgi:site-specific recombinase XerD